MKEHAELGARIVREALTPEQVSWVRGHHERWDGNGYPDALRAEECPEGARIMALADAWDVMTSDRTYTSCPPLGAGRARRVPRALGDPVLAARGGRPGVRPGPPVSGLGARRLMLVAIAIAGVVTIGLLALTAALVGDDAPGERGRHPRRGGPPRRSRPPPPSRAPVDRTPETRPGRDARLAPRGTPGRVLAVSYTPVVAAGAGRRRARAPPLPPAGRGPPATRTRGSLPGAPARGRAARARPPRRRWRSPPRRPSSRRRWSPRPGRPTSRCRRPTRPRSRSPRRAEPPVVGAAGQGAAGEGASRRGAAGEGAARQGAAGEGAAGQGAAGRPRPPSHHSPKGHCGH